MTDLTEPRRAFGATATWVLPTIVVAALVPLGGFVVLLVSRLPRFAGRRPSWALLLVLATAVLVIQLVGLNASWTAPTGDVSPATLAP